MQFDKGFDTIIGDRGVKLSGGQKQRLSIHRKVVEIFKKKTLLIIAHRLSTIKDADTIYVMDSGGVIEQGTHTELIQNQEKYYQLYSKELNEKESA